MSASVDGLSPSSGRAPAANPDDATLGAGELLAALKALRQGDVGVRLSTDFGGVAAEIAEAFNALAEATGARGIFLLYEPTRAEGEDRDGFLERFGRVNKPLWNVLTPAEWDQIWHHITTCDFPETSTIWCELGRAAGFAQAERVFADPTRFLQMFRFSA